MYREKLSMWWRSKIAAGSKRKTASISLLSGFCLLLTACGFHPMYGDNSEFTESTPLAGNLVIAPIGGREGQILKIALEDKLNPEGRKSAAPEYRLQVTLAKSLIPSVVRNDGTIQRYDLQFNSGFALIRTADNKTLLTGNIRHTGSYNVAINATFATYESEQDVIARTLNEIAEDYVLRLSGFFSGKQ